MRLHVSTIVRDVQNRLWDDRDNRTRGHLIAALKRAWHAWEYSLQMGNEFGANSFGLIALGTVFDCLEELDIVAPIAKDAVDSTNSVEVNGKQPYEKAPVGRRSRKQRVAANSGRRERR